MTRIKNVLMMVLFCMTAVIMSVCNTGACSPATEKDPKEAIVNAYQQLNELKNYHMTMKTITSLKFQGKNINAITNGEFDIHAKPMLMKSVITVQIDIDSKKNEQTILQYIEETGNQFISYSNVNNQWVKETTPYFNPLNEYENYIKAIKSVTPIRETTDAIVYEVVVDGSCLQESVERIMATAGMQKIKLPVDIFKDVGDIKYNIMINKNTSLTSELYFDMSDLLRGIANNTMETLKIPEGQKLIFREVLDNMKMVSTITFSQANSLGEIIIPEEAKAAVAKTLSQQKQP